MCVRQQNQVYGDKPLPKQLRAWVKNELPQLSRVLKKPLAGALFPVTVAALTTGEVFALEQAGEDAWRRRLQAMNPWTTLCTIEESGIVVSEQKVREVVRIIDGGGRALAQEVKGHSIEQVKDKVLSLKVREYGDFRRVHVPVVAHSRCGQREQRTVHAGVLHHQLAAHRFPPACEHVPSARLPRHSRHLQGSTGMYRCCLVRKPNAWDNTHNSECVIPNAHLCRVMCSLLWNRDDMRYARGNLAGKVILTWRP